MRQRNDTFNTQHVSAWPTEERPDQRPFDVGPNEEIDYPELLAGFTALEEPSAVQEPLAVQESLAVEESSAFKFRRKDAAPAVDKEDGEQA